MVQTIEQSAPSAPSTPRVRPMPEQIGNEFNYRPVPVLAVVGLVLALISSAAVFIWLVLPLCLVALFVSLFGLLMIRGSRGAYGGTGVAVAGMILSVVFFSGGIGYQVYAYQTEVPDGYERINFVRDISSKGFVHEAGQTTVHPDVAALDGKKVFLKGYIYQTGKLENLTAFLLVKDNQSCCFGANPALTDRLGVVMQDGKSINYTAGKVAIAGTFRLNPKYDPHGNLDPIYLIEGDQFSKRVSDF